MNAEALNRLSHHKLGPNHEQFKIIIEREAMKREIGDKDLGLQIKWIKRNGRPLENITREVPYFVAERGRGNITSEQFNAALEQARKADTLKRWDMRRKRREELVVSGINGTAHEVKTPDLSKEFF